MKKHVKKLQKAQQKTALALDIFDKTEIQLHNQNDELYALVEEVEEEVAKLTALAEEAKKKIEFNLGMITNIGKFMRGEKHE